MISIENIEDITILFLLVLWIFYSIWYVINKKHFSALYNIMKKVFIETYKYSLNLLTVMFLIVFYLELIIHILFIKEFSVGALIERNPINNVETIMFFPIIILMIGSIIWWSKKIMKLVEESFLQIRYDNGAVTITIRLISFILFIIFHSLILLPMFSYGLVGAFGNPRI